MTDQTAETKTTETTPPPADTLLTEEPKVDLSQGKPENLPDEFWDAEKNAPVFDKLINDWQRQSKIAKDLRVKLSKGEFEGKPPEDIKEYQLELDEKLKPLVPDDDPIFNAAREAAKQAGLPKEAFSKFMMPVISKLAEIKAASEVEPTEEELAAARQVEIDKLGPTGSRIVESVGAFIKELQANGTLSQAEAAAAKRMVFDADTARVMNKLRMMSGVSKDVPVDVPMDNKASIADVEKKMAQALVANNEDEYNKYSQMLSKMR